MIFTDPAFLFGFLPLVCLLFYQLTRRFGTTAGLALIFVASALFYAPWGWQRLVLLVAAVTANFVIAQALLALPDSRVRLRWTLVIAGELLNFLVLFCFKYQILRLILPGSVRASLGMTDFAIPVGISFYTFHQAAFLADAFKRDPSTVSYFEGTRRGWGWLRGYVRYGAFVTFFPQLVIGPITYLREFGPQIERRGFGRVRQRDIAVGVMLVAIGLFKKVVIADNVAPLADRAFTFAAQGVPLHTLEAWVGVLAYYAQLYFDFSGYSDMAIGIARLLGMRFPINFFSPLKAVGIIDFYRRWHMTLTRVISRFLYTPLSLSGTRFALSHGWPRGASRVLGVWLPLLMNFEVIGLWHGARWTYVVFGAIHGVWYVVETEVRASAPWKRWRKATPDALRTCLGRAIFFMPMALTFALFRSENLASAWELATRLFVLHPEARRGSLAQPALMLGAAFAIIFLLPNSVELTRRWRPGLLTYDNESYVLGLFAFRWQPTWAWTTVLVGFTLTAAYFAYRQPPFLYMGF